jgi:spore maturation protein SpmB
MSTFSHELKKSVFLGIKKGTSSYIWMLKILIPVSFLTMVFVYSGLMNHIDFLLQPAMAILSLPPEAALPLLVGVFTGPSACIASMAALSLSTEHMTLIAIFVLISHALIQEGIIQSKSGLPIFMATFIRLAASVLTVIVVAWFLPTGQSVAGAANGIPINHVSFMAMLGAWGVDTLFLCAKILVIIMPLMCILEIMKQFNLIDHFVKPLTPLLRILGLDKKVGMLWLTAVIFGLLYGAAVIVEAAKKGNFTREELQQLQVSIGINHSMLEDPALFLSLGLGPFWLWVPRLLAAIIAVYSLKIFYRIKSSIGTSAISIKNEK